MAEDRKVLARGLRRRDPELLNGLIEQYQYRLFRYLLYLTASPETAEDLFQETWIRVLLFVAGVVTAVAITLGSIILLAGYVNQDAKRRGMNSTLWTILVAMLLPAYLFTGFVIYFLIREPLPYHCTQCGSMVSARFNFCPQCKCNLRPTCRQCKREVGERDRYCPYCGEDVSAG